MEVALAMRGGMGGNGLLPFAGGYAEQPAALMMRCRAILAVDARLEAAKAKRRGG